MSRKAWAYVLTKSKKEKRAEVSVKTLEEFKDEVGVINGLTGDNEFSSAAIKKFCDDNDIRLDTSVAKEEHISNGNNLGIIDRLVRTDWLALVDGYCYVGRQRSWTWIKLDSARSAVPGSTRSANASVAHAYIY